MELVVVSQNGCAPCKSVKNYLKVNDIEFKEFNITTQDSVEIELTPFESVVFTAEDLDVMGTPVTILFDEGEEVARVAGFNTQGIKMLISQM